MNLHIPGRFAMLRRSVLELPRGAELDVACAGGALWLTLDHDPRDIVLQPGEQVRVGGDRRALVYALEDAVLELGEAGATRGVRQPAPARSAQGRARLVPA